MTSLNFDITRRIPEGKSSQIARLDYSTESNVLRVEFKNGGTYDYLGVPANVAAPGLTLEIKAPFSLGSWFASEIKNVYAFRKVEFAEVL
jgi:hypothetical protein